MAKAWMKFLLKLNVKDRIKLEFIIIKILNNEFDLLDIKPFLGQVNHFRVRIGKIRIIFIKNKDENIIEEIGFRGDIYK